MESLDYSSLPFPVHVDLVPPGQTTQRTGIAMRPQWVTIHETDNLRVGAAGHNRWLHGGARDDNGNPQQLSVHFFVDDHEAFQCIPLNEVAWHAGDGGGPGNMTSLAIETCVNSDGDFDRTRGNVAQLTALLVEAFDIPADGVVQHNHWSGKDCPKRMRHENLWEDQLERVRGTAKKVDFEPFAEARVYHVPRDRQATGRARPSRTAPEVETFLAGAEIACDGILHGQAVGGDDRWLRTSDDRHLAIHASGLVEGPRPQRPAFRLPQAGPPWDALDEMNDEIAEAAEKTGVPAHLIKSMLAREGSFGRDWGRPPYPLRNQHMMPFNGIFESTATSRGIDFRRMFDERGYAIWAMGEVLRQIKDQQGFQAWDDVAAYYFAGPNWNNPDWGDETGENTVCNYVHGPSGVITRMKALDALFG